MVQYREIEDTPMAGKIIDGGAKASKYKVPTSGRLPADDCEVHIGQVIDPDSTAVLEEGVSIWPHRGEWVEVIMVRSVAEVSAVSDLASMAGVENAPIGKYFDKLCHSLSKRVIAWNWTDLSGEPMDQPHGHPEVLAELLPEELIYLVGLTGSSQTPEMIKNGSGPSGGTSSETPMLGSQ